MRCRQNTSILHMALKIPELLQAHTTNIHNVGRRNNRRLRVRPLQQRTHGHDEAEEVLVQREETQQALGNTGGFLGLGGQVVCAQSLIVGGHVLRVEVFDFENVDGDTAAITTTGPLGVLSFIILC